MVRSVGPDSRLAMFRSLHLRDKSVITVQNLCRQCALSLFYFQLVSHVCRFPDTACPRLSYLYSRTILHLAPADAACNASRLDLRAGPLQTGHITLMFQLRHLCLTALRQPWPVASDSGL